MEAASNWQESRAFGKRWIGLGFIGISLLVIAIDNTILNVALPSISRQLGATASDLQWIIDAYVLVFAALLLTMGAIGDRIGRKRALQGGLILFGIGSLASALSTTTEMLIVSRAFLGIGGATIMPATLSIISATFPAKERPQAIALWAAVFGMGVGIGPVLGGWLLERFDWNAVFFVNLPVVVVALIGGAYYLGESKDESAPKIDIPGVILSITGLFALIYGIIEAGFAGWGDPNVLLAFGAAAVLLGLFAWWENHTDQPMLPLYFFKNMSFTGANTAMALVMFSLFGSVFFLSQYTQSVLGYAPLQAGLFVLPLAITLAITASLSARVAARLGTKYTVALGIFIASLGLWFMALVLDVDTPIIMVIVGQIIFSTGMGMGMSPATNSIMGSVPVSKAGIGSAMNDTTRQLGGALGVAVLGTFLNNTYIQGIEGLSNNQIIATLLPAEAIEAISKSIQAAHIIAAQITVPAVAEVITQTANRGFVDGMNNAMLIGAGIMLATSLLTLAILPNQVRRPEEPAEEEARDVALEPGADGMIPVPVPGD